MKCKDKGKVKEFISHCYSHSSRTFTFNKDQVAHNNTYVKVKYTSALDHKYKGLYMLLVWPKNYK